MIAEEHKENRFKNLKSELENSLLFWELKDRHGWDITAKENNDCVTVNMSKTGPLDSIMTVSFPVISMDGDDFENIHKALKSFRFDSADQKRFNQCIMAAIRGEVFHGFQYGDDFGVPVGEENNRISFAVDFAPYKDKIKKLTVDDVAFAVDEINEEIMTVSECVDGEQFDSPELYEIIDYLDAHSINYFHEVKLEDGENKIHIQDEAFNFDFDICADIGTDCFILDGGLVFDRDSENQFETMVSSMEITGRLDLLERPVGECSMGNAKFYVYAVTPDLPEDGPYENPTYALIGMDRNDVSLCPKVKNTNMRDCYQFEGKMFFPVDEIKSLPDGGPGYADIKKTRNKEPVSVDEDNEPGSRHNVRSDYVRTQLDRNIRRMPDMNEGHTVWEHNNADRNNR